jgi:threonine/homoserine/homoserine lactone efflux protein
MLAQLLAFLAMKTVGAAYLVALGLRSLWTAAGISFPGRRRSGTGPGRAGVGGARLGLSPGRWRWRALDGVSGVVLVGFGARLALQQR